MTTRARRVALATDLNPNYCFFAPITEKLWLRAGYLPYTVYVGTPAEWSKRKSINERCLSAGGGFAYVPVPEGYCSANAAQIARMYVWTMAAAQDYVLTSDIDMWPINGEWFHTNEPESGQVSILYANNRTRFPLCYVGAHAETWQELLQPELDSFGIVPTQIRDDYHRRFISPVVGCVHAHMKNRLSPTTHPADAWQHDEEWLTNRIHQWAGWPDRCKFVDRAGGDPPGDRIDRAHWSWSQGIPGVIDAHLPRPGYDDKNWPKIRRLLSVIAPDMVAWADRYREEFLREGV